MADSRSIRRLASFFCLALVVSVALLYSQAAKLDFIYFDDDFYITQNTRVQAGITADNIEWAFKLSPDQNYWHPLTWIMHMAACQVFGLNPGAHHLINVTLHTINTVLMFIALLLMTRMPASSFIAALVFGTHPLNVESVAWVAELKNVLSMMFWWITIILYVVYTRKPSARRYVLSFFAFFLGLLSKPGIVTLPFVLCLLDIWPLDRTYLNRFGGKGNSSGKTELSRLILEKIPFILLAVGTCLITMKSLDAHNAIVKSIKVPFSLRIENALVSFVKYILKFFFPVDLAVYYPFPEAISLPAVIVSLFLIVAVTLITVVLFKKMPVFFAGWFWFTAAFGPVSGIIQGGLWPAMADRWMYIPQIGIIMILVFGIGPIIQRKISLPIFVSIICSILFVYSSLTWRQLAYWQNTGTLFKHALAVTVPNPISYNQLGAYYYDQQQLDDWCECLKTADDLFEDVKIKNNFGMCLMLQKKYRDAIPYLKIGLEYGGSTPKKQLSIANCYGQIGDVKNAARHMVLALDGGMEITRVLGIIDGIVNKNQDRKVWHEYLESIAELRNQNPEHKNIERLFNELQRSAGDESPLHLDWTD